MELSSKRGMMRRDRRVHLMWQESEQIRKDRQQFHILEKARDLKVQYRSEDSKERLDGLEREGPSSKSL